jgi:hypothetical protein
MSLSRIICSLVLCKITLGYAQNLVPNGSFEQYTTCPTYFGLAHFCEGWLNLYTQSADYFNSCNTNGVVDVPLSQFGYQYPAEGEGYMGMATYVYNQPEYREMIGIQLAEPLQIGVPVCLSFKVAVGGFGTSIGNSAGYTCKGIGLRFFTELPTDQYIYAYPNSAALFMNEVPTDTAMWHWIDGTYVPDSAYAYVVVGNFFADSLNAPIIQDSIGLNASDWAYAFVDDVRVSYEATYCTAGSGLGQPELQTPHAYPLPFTDVLYVRSPWPGRTAFYTLTDIAGRVIHQGTMQTSNSDAVIETSAVRNGVYVLQIFDQARTSCPLTVIHVSP